MSERTRDRLSIGGRPIRGVHDPVVAAPTFVIAEVGVNHDGSVDRALALVDSAAEAGADAVKFQWFDADLLLAREAELAEYQERSGARTAHAMLSALELEAPAFARIVARAEGCGVVPVVTVFSPELVAPARDVGFGVFKIASPDLVNRPLLETIDSFEAPMLLSTGASDLIEIDDALGWIDSTRAALLHCVSAYPTPPEHANLAAITTIARATTRPTGYSDHTALESTGALAVAAGAALLEKHLTHDRRAPGPDHAASLEPSALARYIERVREAERMLGDGRKEVDEIEREVRRIARQSLALARDLVRGERIGPDDLRPMRPGTGIPAARLPELIGRVVARDVHSGALLRESDLADDAANAGQANG